MRKIAVLTSGGDAPGMNAAIRSVTRCGIAKGWDVFGVSHGYAGLIAGEFIPLGARQVGGILQLGGTMLGSARSLEFKTDAGREKALESLRQNEIDALVVIGGNGSQAGAWSLTKLGFPVVGVASTIDNDLYGSDITLGVDTALNIALESIDRLRVTAASHRRAFLVEVMGRDSGYLALMSGIAGGAEAIVIPEFETTPEEIAAELLGAYQRGKLHGIIVVAEGARYNAEALVQYFKDNNMEAGFELRATILGHVQRGGAPGAFDRLLGTRLADAAVEALARGKIGVLAGSRNGHIVTTPYAEVVGNKKQLDPHLIELSKTLAR